MDPDCCSSPECTNNMYCRASPDPAEILLRKQPPSTTASFYEKMRFLVEENSVQMETSKNAFNERCVPHQNILTRNRSYVNAINTNLQCYVIVVFLDGKWRAVRAVAMLV